MTYRLATQDEYDRYREQELKKQIGEAISLNNPPALAKVIAKQIETLVHHYSQKSFMLNELSEISAEQSHEQIKMERMLKFATFYGLLIHESDPIKTKTKTNQKVNQ